MQISKFRMNLFNLGPHNKYRQYNNWAKVPSEFNQTEWLLRPPALLNEVRSYWQMQGHSISVDDRNSFRLRRSSTILAGKPNPAALKGKEAVHIYVKMDGRAHPTLSR